jgi:putative PEP-CTERM system TPR-repeat lipoprotein
MLLARALIAAKDYDRAIDKLRDALLINPDFYEANREIVAIYAMSGRDDQAAQEIKSLQRRRPDDARVYLLEGDLLAKEQKFAESDAAFRNAQKRAPDDGAIAAKIHAVGVAAGKTAAADAAADKWLRDHPKDIVLRGYLAERALRNSDYKTASRHYQAIVLQQPDNVVYLNNLAWVSGELNDPKALSYAEKAASLAPDNAEVLDTWGTLLIKKGDVSQGVEKIQRAAQLAPAQADIRLHLAKGLIQAGNKDAARRELNALMEASTASPDNPAAEKAKGGNTQPAPGGKASAPVCNPKCASEAAELLKKL